MNNWFANYLAYKVLDVVFTEISNKMNEVINGSEQRAHELSLSVVEVNEKQKMCEKPVHNPIKHIEALIKDMEPKVNEGE